MAITYSLTNSASGKYSLTGNQIKVASALTLGTDTITVRATDDNGWIKDTNINITVANAPTISGTPGAATIGAAYSFTPTVSGGGGTKTYSVSGTLPDGLSFSTSTGAITGTPTTAGTFSGISITVTDPTGSATLSSLSITVSSNTDIYSTAQYQVDWTTNTVVGAAASTDLFIEGGALTTCYWEIPDGSLVSITANQANIQRTVNGYEQNPDRTNIVLWNRDLTNAAWTKTNVTAAKNQNGRLLNGAAQTNAASSITATANGGTVLQSITLASSQRRMSADVKRLVGTGTLEMTTDGGTTWTAVTVTNNWTRVSIPAQTVTDPVVGFRIGTSGDSFAIDYVQNENGPTVTSRIPTTTAAARRWHTRLTCAGKAPLVNLMNSNTFSAYWEGWCDPLGGGGLWISGVGPGILAQPDGSILNTNIEAGRFTMGVGVIQKFAFSATGGVIRSTCNGGPVRTTTFNNQSASSHFDISSNGAGTADSWGQVKRNAFWTTALDDASLIALTTL